MKMQIELINFYYNFKTMLEMLIIINNILIKFKIII